jgi:hypothetical protein
MPPVIEVIQVILSSVGMGFSGNGWLQANSDYVKSVEDGIEESLGVGARWRIAREKSRFLKLLLIFVRASIVAWWRFHNPAAPSAPFLVYASGNGILLVITVIIIWDSYLDRSARREIVAIVYKENRMRRRSSDLPGGNS